jgi:arylsulfatase A-like enzyme
MILVESGRKSTRRAVNFKPAEEDGFQIGAGRVRGDMVYELDWTIGRILAKLDERGLARDTLVIVTSDNGGVAKSDEGEDFGHKSCGELRGNKGGIYEGGHRVPFLARWPARAPAGTVNGSLVVLTDMLATFAELAAVQAPAGAGPDGTSIVPALGGATMDAAARPAVVLHSGGGQFAIRSGRWKLIFNAQFKPVELYDLEADLREKSNELKSQPELVARLEQEFRRIHGANL